MLLIIFTASVFKSVLFSILFQICTACVVNRRDILSQVGSCVVASPNSVFRFLKRTCRVVMELRRILTRRARTSSISAKSEIRCSCKASCLTLSNVGSDWRFVRTKKDATSSRRIVRANRLAAGPVLEGILRDESVQFCVALSSSFNNALKWSDFWALLLQIIPWRRGSVVLTLVLTDELSLIYAWSLVDIWPLVGKLSAVGQPTRPTQPSIPLGSVNE